MPPPALSCADPHRCPVPAAAQGPTEPHGSSVPRACPGGVRAARPWPVSLTTCTASLGQKRAVLLLSLLCGDSFSWSSHFCFLGRKQNKIHPAPARRSSSSDLDWIYFPAFSIALLSGSLPLHSCPPWATEQKHHNDPPLSFLLLVNHFISFL